MIILRLALLGPGRARARARDLPELRAHRRDFRALRMVVPEDSPAWVPCGGSMYFWFIVTDERHGRALDACPSGVMLYCSRTNSDLSLCGMLLSQAVKVSE